MGKIILEVDDSADKIFNNLSDAGRQQFNLTVSLMLRKALNDATFSTYDKILNETGAEALKNGLTEEILETLLASRD